MAAGAHGSTAGRRPVPETFARPRKSIGLSGSWRLLWRRHRMIGLFWRNSPARFTKVFARAETRAREILRGRLRCDLSASRRCVALPFLFATRQAGSGCQGRAARAGVCGKLVSSRRPMLRGPLGDRTLAPPHKERILSSSNCQRYALESLKSKTPCR